MVYIGDKNSNICDIIPRPLSSHVKKTSSGDYLDIYGQKLNDHEEYDKRIEYWKDRNIIYTADAEKGRTASEVEYSIAGKIAGHIFDKHATEFDSFRQEREKRVKEKKRRWALSIGIVISALLTLFLTSRCNHIVDNRIAQSHVAYSEGDKQAAEKIALQTVEKNPFSRRAKSHLRTFLSPGESDKCAIISTWVEFSSDGSKLCLYDSDSEGRYIRVLSSKDFSEQQRIKYFNSTPMRVIPSRDMSHIAVLDFDSLRVYNVESGMIVKTDFIEAGSDGGSCIYDFSEDGNSFISCRWDSIIETHLNDESSDTLIIGGEHRFIRGHLLCKKRDAVSAHFYQILNNPLRTKEIARYDCNTDLAWDYCPETNALAVMTENGLVVSSDNEEKLLSWDNYDPSSVSYLAYSSKGILACVQNGRLCFPLEEVQSVRIGDTHVSWISDDEIKYLDTRQKPHLLNVSDGHTYSFKEDFPFPNYKCYGNYIFNYISPINTVGGYSTDSEIGKTACIKYLHPRKEDDDDLKEFHYYDNGTKTISRYDRLVQTDDLKTGSVLWSTHEHVWEYNLCSQTAALQNKLVDINTGETICELGWRSKYLGDNYLATTISYDPDTIQIISIDGTVAPDTLYTSIDNVFFKNNRFIVSISDTDYYINDITVGRSYIIHDDIPFDKSDFYLSDDGTYFMRTTSDKDWSYHFYLFDLNDGTLLFDDWIKGAIMPRIVLNNRTACFVAENKIAFYDLLKRTFTKQIDPNFEIFGNPKKWSKDRYLIDVDRSGIYEINLANQTFSKKKYPSKGTSLSVIDNEYLFTDGRLCKIRSGRVLAVNIDEVSRISDGFIYCGKNIEYRIPLLSDCKLYQYCKAEVGERVLSEAEDTYYKSKSN